MNTDTKYPYVDPSDPRSVKQRGESPQAYANRMEGLNAYYRNRMERKRSPVPKSQPSPKAKEPAQNRRGGIGGLYDYIADAMSR